MRVYRQAGFELHPQMYLTGTVDRSAIPVVEKVREGSAGRHRPDGLRWTGPPAAPAHGVDHELMLRTWRLLVSDTTTGSGYAYVDERGRLALLAASNRRTATRLLWAALADGDPRPPACRHVTGANQWVLDVGFAARLDAAPGRLPGAARDETARAVRSQRCTALSTTPRE